MNFRFSWMAAILALSVSGLQAKTYELDNDHTSVTFKIRHLLSNVQGRFKMTKGTFEIDDKTGRLTKVEATTAAKTIDTNNEKRDKHLRSADFFDTDKFADIKFVSEKVDIKKGGSGDMTGDLTMHGVTKKVTFKVEFNGEAKDPWGNDRAAFTAKLDKLNRKDYGLNWNKALETGGVLVGDEVNIEIDVEGTAKILDKAALKEKTEKANAKTEKKDTTKK